MISRAGEPARPAPDGQGGDRSARLRRRFRAPAAPRCLAHCAGGNCGGAENSGHHPSSQAQPRCVAKRGRTGRRHWRTPTMDLGILGRKALVLGSSQGLGYAIARTLVSEGAGVTLTGRSSDKLAAAAAALAAGGAAVATEVVDLSDAASVSALVERIADRAIDILVLNSGGPPPGPVGSVDTELWTSQFATMVSAPLSIAAAVVPGMRARRIRTRRRHRLVRRAAADPQSGHLQCAAGLDRGLGQDTGRRSRGRRRDGQLRAARPHPHLPGRPTRRCGGQACRHDPRRHRGGFPGDHPGRALWRSGGIRRRGRLPRQCPRRLHHRHHVAGGRRHDPQH